MSKQRIYLRIEAITRDPFAGSGKPEPLKHPLSSSWSRRLNTDNGQFTKWNAIRWPLRSANITIV